MKNKRPYNDQTITAVRALSWPEPVGQRALAKLHHKWPKGILIRPANRTPYFEPWPKFLAGVLVNVLAECGPCDPLLTYTPTDRRRA